MGVNEQAKCNKTNVAIKVGNLDTLKATKYP